MRRGIIRNGEQTKDADGLSMSGEREELWRLKSVIVRYRLNREALNSVLVAESAGAHCY